MHLQNVISVFLSFSPCKCALYANLALRIEKLQNTNDVSFNHIDFSYFNKKKIVKIFVSIK